MVFAAACLSVFFFQGDLAQINNIPFAGMTASDPSTVMGTGYTPEGIDQNPVYYEFMAQVCTSAGTRGHGVLCIVCTALHEYSVCTIVARTHFCISPDWLLVLVIVLCAV